MSEKLNVVIEKSESGYLAFCPELSKDKFENHSLDVVFTQLKQFVQQRLNQPVEKETTGQSILKMVDKFKENITEADINQLPADAAAQHDHYLYQSTKQDQ
ncbi:MAG: hypothetical protein SAJ12_04090 [Jaaginema sp. PMC 1079.18]|nr:hypothetical protein [Jaaginema sp. PMC 1080.18]MEC4850169.1 hypothetical protein [Jaaginema sp. PMC 1079.18]MEC4865102.1 hypothetical protein [Jaaginema sp. PMC 1078.18]